MIDSTLKFNEMRMEGQHQRGFEHAAMFDGPAGEAIRIELRDCLVRDKVPVGEDNNLYVGNAVPLEFTQRQVDSFGDEPGILEMSVDDGELPAAVASKFLQHVAQGMDQR